MQKIKTRRIIIDLDNTIIKSKNGNYREAIPIKGIKEKLRALKQDGYEIVIYTSRNMHTHGNNLGKITAHTVPIILEWLQNNGIPYDELFIGKPWCGENGYYVDDRAIRPSELLKYSHEEILELLAREIF